MRMLEPVSQSLVAKIGLAFAITVVLAVAGTAVLNVLRFEQLYQDFVARRLRAVMADIRRDATVGLDLGLSLQSVENLPLILARHGRADAAIRILVVHDCAGDPIAQGGATVDDKLWRDHLEEGSWQTFAGDAVLVGERVDNALGECAGGIAIGYNAQEYRQTIRAFRRNILLVAALSLLVAVPALLVIRSLVGRKVRSFVAMEADLDAILTGRASAAGEEMAPVEGEERLAASYRGARPVMVQRVGAAPEASRP